VLASCVRSGRRAEGRRKASRSLATRTAALASRQVSGFWVRRQVRDGKAEALVRHEASPRRAVSM
jgi:hypothetical protein